MVEKFGETLPGYFGTALGTYNVGGEDKRYYYPKHMTLYESGNCNGLFRTLRVKYSDVTKW